MDAGHRGRFPAADPGSRPRPLRSRARAARLVLLTFAIALAACGQPVGDRGDIAVTMRVEPDPPRVGPARIELTLRDAAGQPVRGARLSIEGNMTHPGMTPSVAVASETGPGEYRADLQLTMAGDWIVTVDADLGGRGRMTRTLELPGVRPR